MTFLLLQTARLVLTGCILIGGYELFCGFLEKDRKKKRIGILMIVIPVVLLVLTVAAAIVFWPNEK